MKQQLLDWGFDLKITYNTLDEPLDEPLELFEIEKGVIMVRVVLNSGTLKSVQIGIDRNIADVPNCNSTLGLFTLLYQLELIEI